MRGRILMVTLWMASLFVFAACHDDDDDDDKGYTPGKSVVAAFEAKFPNAVAVSWEKKGVYEKAEFHQNGQEVDAWFDASGQWVMTETDVLFANLPAEVKTGFNESIYSAWQVEDVDMLERLNMPTVYRLEIEKGNEEMLIYFNEKGELVKEVNEEASTLPMAVSSFITEQYPKALVVTVDRWQDGMLEVGVLDGSLVKEILFDRNNGWMKTSWPVLKADVPQVVLDVLKGEAYNSFSIASVQYIEYASGNDVYHFVLQKEHSMDISVEIDPQGNLVLD